ncbi:uncharacterized protein MYCFIDRAFT_212354 [Pseudocercospora fijiensis CIRAD86]|uniref:Uncharacterized protein n=1 Tax=Pseudocercospora fijiensis (strain CIRAD86) TaxID=383855 RepID=M3A1Q3_PSEFD|nr:uncharacterized protein MYCFIDRAFT_212354 [Pseudocercospora fijiensis CIRAD86]EME78301.1 hypothetical protein MYCFIDRAFT_212354 [Pseudocercospora fijiensis CIRAD86]
MAVIKFIPGKQRKQRKPRQLGELLQTLPQELFDKIYDLTFTAEPGLRDLGDIIGEDQGLTCRRRYRGQQFLGADTRALLQVDRASRAKFASSYYGEGSVFLAHSHFAASTWSDSVDPQHRRLIAALPRKLSWAEFCTHEAKNIIDAEYGHSKQILAELRKIGIRGLPTDQEWDNIYDLDLDGRLML